HRGCLAAWYVEGTAGLRQAHVVVPESRQPTPAHRLLLVAPSASPAAFEHGRAGLVLRGVLGDSMWQSHALLTNDFVVGAGPCAASTSEHSRCTHDLRTEP